MNWRVFEENGEFGFEILDSRGRVVTKRFGYFSRSDAEYAAYQWGN